jgi:rhomboid protease GluP
MNDYQSEIPPTASQSQYLPLPLHKAYVTYVLLGAIGIVFLLTTLAGGSTNSQVLVNFGANYGPFILDYDEYWRLFTSMFLHAGVMHLAFNAYALFIFGLEMERLYGPGRFAVVYLLSGLFGSLASFAFRGEDLFSVGASGAIFGIIGMNLAYFTSHRHSFGHFGRQRMVSTLVIIGINLVFGFTYSGIDNWAHMGGLVAGAALGYGLAPRYEVDQYVYPPRVKDKTSFLGQSWVVAIALLLLGLGIYAATIYWQGGIA